MVQEKAKEENEKEIELKSTLEVVLPSASQIRSGALHYPNLGVKVNITKQTLFSFLMSKLEMRLCMTCFL